MAKEKIRFSIFDLTCADPEGYPSVDDLTRVLESQFIYEQSKFTYSVITEVVDKYFWISINYGAANPRSSHLIDSSQSNVAFGS
ncbi:MAG: hypothetical protein L3J67_06085 [Hyphomicrobiaceae bacterium]|nr:hypothetical protein [Hyphomicrobiaceae bacterium]